jgi:putative lipoprotein
MRSKRALLLSAVTVTCLIVVIACAGPSDDEPVASAPRTGEETPESAPASPATLVGSWVAVAVGGEPVPDGVEVSLTVEPDGGVSGSTGCNRYHGTMTVDEASVEIGPLATTRKACPSPAMEVEAAFERAMSEVEGFERDGARVRLLDGSGVVRLEWIAAENDAVDG